MTRKSNGEHGSSGSDPGPELFLHRSCPRTSAAYPLGFLGRIREEGYALLFYPVATPAFPSLIVAQSGGGGDGFFISSVEDSVLGRCAALESLCSSIGFGRFELNLCYTF